MSTGYSDSYDPLRTLPSEDLPEREPGNVLEWIGVIAFHPDASRVGESWSQAVDGSDLVLGRDLPLFTGKDASGSGLLDRRVSREACRLRSHGPHWRLERRPGSSRLRLNGADVLEECELSSEQLAAGIVLSFGQRVIVHLRTGNRDAVQQYSPDLGRLVPGVGEAANALRRAIANAAAASGDVLLIGATGTGKERVARAIHELAAEPSRPWVAVNMAALPAEIAPASLFGVRKGAYTGADSHRQGFFQKADGGTLFLDEIVDAPAAVQPLLLRALQEREVQVVGGESQSVSLRVIAAMEFDPDDHSEFLRPALRYRLGAHEIRLPRLRERREDIGILAVTFLRELLSAETPPWDPDDDEVLLHWLRCFEGLLFHAWPGNIRELKQVIGRMVASGVATPQLPDALRQFDQTAGEVGGVADAFDPGIDSPESGAREGLSTHDRTPLLSEMDEDAFCTAWKRARFEVASVARDLNVSRAAIYRRVERSPDCRLAGDVPLGELLAVLDQCRGDLEATAEQLSVSRRGLLTRLRASGVRSLPAKDPNPANAD